LGTCPATDAILEFDVRTLNSEQIESLQASLRQRRQAIVGMVRDHLHQSDDPSEAALRERVNDSDEVAVAVAIEEVGIAQLSSELDELRAIDVALKRIENGSYGECVECGAAVPIARMIALPTASTCLACQRVVEQGSARRA
jgi:DnaK suppressor protein